MRYSTTGVHFPLPLWLIVLVVAVPLVVAALVYLQKWLTRKMQTQVKPGPQSTSAGCLAVFAGIFVVAGLAALFVITVRPTYRSWQASRWPTTQGTVLSSKLDVNRNSDGGDTYRIDVRYRYAVAGRDFESNQYDATGVSIHSGFGLDKMRAAVAAHPPGSTVVVHYDPADPADAMLSTAVPAGTFAFVWFPILFCTLPVLICYAIYRGNKTTGRPGTATPVKFAPTAADARGRRRINFLGILLFALFWNGFVTVFWLATHTWFLMPFALIGLVLIVAAAYSALALFNPLVSVSFARMPVHPGEPCDVAFAVSGNVFDLRSLAFTLEGREKVTYRQGTDTRTETKPVYTFPLYETSKSFEMEKGRFALTLPADVMTSFRAKHNAFSWHVVCRGDMPRRPDIKDEFDVTVLAQEPR